MVEFALSILLEGKVWDIRVAWVLFVSGGVCVGLGLYWVGFVSGLPSFGQGLGQA